MLSAILYRVLEFLSRIADFEACLEGQHKAIE